MQVRWSNLHQFFDDFFNAFSCKNWLQHAANTCTRKTLKFHWFFVIFGTQIRRKGTKKGDFFQTCCSKGCQEASRDALGTNFEAPGRSFWAPRGALWASLGTLWDHSGSLGKLFGPSWAHVGKQIAANGSKQQKTAAHSNRNQQVISSNC